MFRFEISTIEELIAFRAVICGERIDIQKIKTLTLELNKDTDALIKAEKEDSQTS